MDITLRNAILISLAIHILVIFPGYNKLLSKDRIRHRDRMTVDYVVLDEPKAVYERKAAEAKAVETPKVEIRQKVEAVAPPAVPQAKKKAAVPESQEIVRKQAKIRSTKDYLSYYQLIRERIRQRLKSHYGRQHKEGEVRLEFLLRADGSLLAADVDRAVSTHDAGLIDIAGRSLAEAAPFPPFPKAVDLPRMSFDLTVVFKKE